MTCKQITSLRGKTKRELNRTESTNKKTKTKNLFVQNEHIK